MPNPISGHVFISYSRRDDVAMRRIVKHLRAQGIKAWVDNEKLVPGTPVWENEIEKAIKGAFAIVVVLSPDSKKSEWVLREITLADHHNKRAFPVLVAGSKEDSIPFRLITRQYVDIRDDEKSGLNSLSSAISFYVEELIRIEEERQAAEREMERLKQERERAEIAARKAEEKAEAERRAKEQAEQIARAKAEEERITKAKLEAERIANKKADTERKNKETSEHTTNAKIEDKDAAKKKPTEIIYNWQSSISRVFKKYLNSMKLNKNILTGFLILTTFIALLGINQFIEIQKAKSSDVINAAITADAKATNTAKAASTITVDAKGTNTAFADVNSINTAFWAAARSTNTAMAKANSTNTAMAIANSTNTAFFAESRSTNTAKAASTITAVAAKNFISNAQSSAQLVYGPAEGSLVHDENDNSVEVSTASIDDLENFIVEATFQNPYSTLTLNDKSWAYGFLFRDEGGNNQYRLYIFSTSRFTIGFWLLTNHMGDGSGTEVQTGSLGNIDIRNGGSNTIWLYAQGSVGILYINGDYVAELDLSARTKPGKIRVGTGFLADGEIDGYSTDYTNFSVWEIP